MPQNLRQWKLLIHDLIRFLSFVEFPYEGKKLAAYAEKRVFTIYLHMETLARNSS